MLLQSNKEQKNLMQEEAFLRNSQSSQKLKNDEKQLKLKKEKMMVIFL